MILVTGNRGFVGGHLTRSLEGIGEAVAGFDILDGKDIRKDAFPEAQKVFHLAAHTDAQANDMLVDAATNIIGTIRLLERYGSRVVFASSSAVNYPVTPYAISKRAAEDYARLCGAAVVRFPNLYGRGGHGVIERFEQDAVLIIRGEGNQRRSYAPVETAVAALLAAQPGDMVVLPGMEYTVNELADAFPDKPRAYVPARRFDIIDGVQK